MKKREEEEREAKRRREEEERLRLEAERRLLLAQETEREKMQQQEVLSSGKSNKIASITARSLYEQALATKQHVQKPVGGDKIVTLRRGTINDIRNKIFERKDKENDNNLRKKIKKKPEEERTKNTEGQLSTKENKEKIIPQQKADNGPKTTEICPEQEEIPSSIVIKEEEKEVMLPKANKRQSFITDFAALEKTYRILGISREPAATSESNPTVKKRHCSEGKVKNKDKGKKPEKGEVSKTQQLEKNDKPKLKVEIVEKGASEAKKNFFQELINDKKGLTSKEPIIIGPKMRKKTTIASAFEEKNRDSSDNLKRNSVLKEDIKVDPTLFHSFLNKFEPEDKRAEAKLKIAKITADQKEFEKRKKLIEEEKKKKREEEEIKLAIQIQLEEQIREQELLAREEEIRAEFEQQQINHELKKKESIENKKKIKKKKLCEPPAEDKPMPKMGSLAYSESRSRFEKTTQAKEIHEDIKSSIKVNKLDLNSFLENLKVEDNKPKREKTVTTNKLKSNSFFQTLEKQSSSYETTCKPKKVECHKKISAEIKFEKKDRKEEMNVHSAANNCDVPKQKVRISKSIENSKQTKKENKNASTFSLFIDNTKQFFKSSKEKLYKLSNETLHEIDHLTEEMSKRISKPSTMEMQNYLLSHVLFDKPDMPNKKTDHDQEKQIKEAEFDSYLDKEYKEKIEQYCLLVEDTKPRKRKQTKQKEENLPSLKLVEINAIKQQLKSQFEKPAEKQLLLDEFEMLGNRNIQKVKEAFIIDNDVKRNENTQKHQRKIQSSIIDRIKRIELAENERLKKEIENEERIKVLLEREFRKQTDNTGCTADESTEPGEETSTEDLKTNIRLCLENELTNLEEERMELEETEQLLIEQEITNNILEHSADELRHTTQLQEIREEISHRKRSASNKKKVLERFKHVFESEEVDNNQENKMKVGSIREKLENFLQNSETENKKQFEDNVLTGVSDVMNKVRNRLESQQDLSTPILYSKKEIRRKRNAAALKFETILGEQDNNNVKSDKEWSWKSKSPIMLQNNCLAMSNIKKETIPEKPKKPFQDIKYKELLEDIQAVKERMRERNIEKESEERNEEMKLFMKEIQGYLKEKENIINLEEEESEEDNSITNTGYTKEPNNVKRFSKLSTGALSKQIQTSEPESIQPSKNLVSSSKLVRDIQKKILENDLGNEKFEPVSKSVIKTGLIPRTAELLKPADQTLQLIKAPKLLLKSTSIENEEENPAKTLEELKMEQKNKKWSYKDKNIMDLQFFIKSNDTIAPDLFKQQQKTLQDLDEELDIIKNLVTNDNTDIIVQIREEKEKEFSNFMKEVKSYITSDVKVNKVEEEFRTQMKSYVDLIETPAEEVKPLSIPELHINTVNKVKRQLLDLSSPESKEKKTPRNVKKLEKSLLSLGNQEDTEKICDTKNKQITKINISSIKDIYECDKVDLMSPKVTRSKTLPVLEKLKSTNNNKIQNIKFQLANKSKTIHESLEYIEDNEFLASPKIIEIIHNFKVARKEEDKVCNYNKFIECVHAFIQQGSRSEEQQIFKENIKAYLDIIENSDPLLNGTPKLKKHTASSSMISSNNKKDQIEKDCKKAANDQGISTEHKLLSSEEKRKEILAKYGLKDRTRHLSDESSCNSLDEYNMEDVRNLTDKELCTRYGLPELYLPEETETEPRQSSNSFIDLISKIRNTSVSRLSPQDSHHLNTSQIYKESSKIGKTLRIKNMFENPESPQVEKKLGLTRSNSCHKEDYKISPTIPAKFLVLQKSSTISDICHFPPKDFNEKHSPKTVRFPFMDIPKTVARSEFFDQNPSVSLERSSSFTKVKNAFENGVGLNEDSDDSDCDNYFQNNSIASELQALKRDNKIQSMFRICRSDSDASRSPNLSRALDKNTLKQVAKSKSAITSMFESQGPKITFGGNKQIIQQPQMTVKKTDSVKSTPLDNRKWVFDTIQKYFDVIVEEEQEGENDKFESTKDNNKAINDEDDVESDYTSAEEEILSESPFSPKVTVSDKFDLQTYFKTGKERRSSSVLGQPIRKVSIDEFVAEAAKKFDELTNDTNLNLEESEVGMLPRKLKAKPILAASCQDVSQLSKSGL